MNEDGGAMRGVAVIVIVGVALGVAFNALGREDWGLPWIGVDQVAEMPTLEQLTAEAPPTPPPPSYNPINDPMAVGLGGSQESDLPQIPDLDRPIQIELAAVKQLFDAGHLVLVDAREPDEFAEGHIRGALNMPFDEVTSEPERLEAIDAQGMPIVAYCGGGTCELSMSLAWELIYAGQTKVLVFMGGYPEWVGAGYPVESGPTEPS